tara:strand:+ start:313 stop:681 length:369 start_codon:yes stop_codon:yes gene_type:complete
MYLQKGNKSDILPPLGFGFLDLSHDGKKIIKFLKVDFKKDCKYYDDVKLKALNTGLIKQSIYNAIKEKEGEKTAIIEAEAVKIEKDRLLKIIPEKLGINKELSVKEIIKAVINAGYQIIITL